MPKKRRLQAFEDFELFLERRENEVALVLAGELDLYRAPEIEQALAQALDSEWDGAAGSSADGKVGKIAVDLRAVTFLDSTTLGLLLTASKRAVARECELVVLVGPQTPMTVFAVTGFDRLLTIRPVDADQSAG